jgi:hypothetical protein
VDLKAPSGGSVRVNLDARLFMDAVDKKPKFLVLLGALPADRGPGVIAFVIKNLSATEQPRTTGYFLGQEGQQEPRPTAARLTLNWHNPDGSPGSSAVSGEPFQV